MDGLVALDNLLLVFLHLGFVHSLDFVVLVEISLLEMFVLPLQLFELPSDTLVILGKCFILIFEGLISFIVILLELSQSILIESILLSVFVLLLGILLFLFT